MSMQRNFFMAMLVLLASCGDGTVRVNKISTGTTGTTDTTGTTGTGTGTGTGTDAVTDSTVGTTSTTSTTGSFSTVSRSVSTVGSYYYSFSGLLHSDCVNEGTAPVCTKTLSENAYTYYIEQNYVNECSWVKAGSPTKVYSYSRPCQY
jgi:hypothetical protein